METTPYSVPPTSPLTSSWIRNDVFNPASPDSCRRHEAHPTTSATGSNSHNSFRRLRERGVVPEIDDPEGRADTLRRSVLEPNHRIHRNFVLASVDRVDDVGVFIVDYAAADLSRSRQFAVIGVELLVEQKEPGDALRRWQRCVDALNLFLN